VPRPIAIQLAPSRHTRPTTTGRQPMVFLGAGLILLPWTAWLVLSLPSSQTAHHWDLAWAGFDAALAAALVAAGVAAARGSAFAPPAAIVAGTLLASDAWFDLLTSRGPAELATAAAEALLIELPLAYLCFVHGTRNARGQAAQSTERPPSVTTTVH
jgi:hypothetical protein